MANAIRIDPSTKQPLGRVRVAAYCRVSSNSADQLNSYANQLSYYTKLSKVRTDWNFIGIFADEGISGTKAENRPEFQRLLRYCKAHQVDLIVTKSVSRFARNVKEALETVRTLKLLGVGVQFEKEGINTLSLGDEMLLNTFTALAQEESEAISQNIRLSIVKRMNDGEYVDSNAPYGYRLVDKQLEIYEPEAMVVRRIFDLYLSGHSTTEIAQMLTEEKIPRKCGDTGKWKSTKISYILGNERYIGDCFYQKTCRDTSVPFKQSVNRGQEDRYYATDTHKAIIDRTTFETVKERLGKNQKRYCKTTQLNTYPLTSHIRCTECGSFYHRKVASGTVKWVCSRHKEDRTLCDSHHYSEERIYDGFIAMVNKLRFASDNILGVLQSKLDNISLCFKRNNEKATQRAQQIADLNAKLLMLEQLRSKGFLSQDGYHAQAREINNTLTSLKSKRQETFASKVTDLQNDLKKLQEILSELEAPLESFDEKLFFEIVEDMTINKNDEMTITILGGLRFTERI